MASFEDLDRRFGRFADRLKAFQQERDQRSKLALTMLASIEHKVRSQAVALDKANTRIAELEKERDAAIARATELVDLYESSLTNNDAFFRGIEQLASKLVGPSATMPPPKTETPAVRASAPPGPPQPPRSAQAPRPVATLPPAPPSRTGVVQAPSKTPFLREMGPSQLQPRDRSKDQDGKL
ncbi:MAG TPA: hypothetical protein VHM01_18335 [Alphaproteobacteria bacterium]|nr:hypothetical protein [Alphaproteobacteria bacterium]